MTGALSLLGFLALASPASPPSMAIDAERLPAFPEPMLVADIVPGPAGSTPRLFRPVQGGAIFFAGPVDPSSFSQGTLWRTDGTPAGTFSIQPQGVEFVGVLSTPGPYQWLQGRDASGVGSVWRTDGTVAGTIKVLDRNSADSFFWYQRKTGRLYFRTLPTGSPIPLRNLWVSDGTPEGTRQLTSLADPPAGLLIQKGIQKVASDPDNGFPGVFAELGDGVFFLEPGPQSGFSLWRTDGTPEGTHFVASPSPNFDFRAVWSAGSFLYLSATIGEGVPAQLWRSDGTTAGTVQVDSFGPDPISGVSLFGEIGNGRIVWLVFEPSENTPSFWATNERGGGAVRLLKLGSTIALQPPLCLNGLLYFLADDGKTGIELWRTDGTSAGTRLAFDLCPGSCSGLYSGVPPLLAADRILTFSGDPKVGTEPLVTDGTRAGTHLLGDLCPGICARFILPDELRDFGGVFLFPSFNPQAIPQIWATDLTPAGTMRLTNFQGGAYQTIRIGDRLVFSADDGVVGRELWSLTIPKTDPLPPAGPWLSSRTLPGFEVKVRITNAGGGVISGVLEPDCIPETLCFSGAVRGRSEVFVRVIGPRPNGRLWPTLVKFTTSEVEVWIRQTSTATIRYYRLEGARPGFDELPGLFDREGFIP